MDEEDEEPLSTHDAALIQNTNKSIRIYFLRWTVVPVGYPIVDVQIW